MEPVFAVVIGFLFAASVYLMLGRNLIKFLFGLILISNAANLAIFVSGRLTWGSPGLIPFDAAAPVGVAANALPQALILTAIVISFGLLAFAMVLAYRAYQELGTVNTDEMRVAEPIEPPQSDGAPTMATTASAIGQTKNEDRAA